MKRRTILVLGLVLLLGAVLSSRAEATPAAGDATWPLTYIARPCVSIGIQNPSGGPARIVCRGITGRNATINVPTPYLSDRAPELSLVSIPTYFNLQWDPDSLGVQDSQPLTISNPIGNPTDKLENVRVQLRLRAVEATGSESSYHLLTENVSVDTTPTLRILELSSPDGEPTGDYADAACLASTKPGANALLTVSQQNGGYVDESGADACATIRETLVSPSAGPQFATFIVPAVGLDGWAKRYLDWTRTISMSPFLTFTPYTSIAGPGTDHGSPAFQIVARTHVIVEARVVWDEHQERYEHVDIECQWSYWDDYDFIDWDRWPDPIYCRRNVALDWRTFCKPFGKPSCDPYYGNPNDWWHPSEVIEIRAIRGPDGSYGTTYDFVSVQSQALLTAP